MLVVLLPQFSNLLIHLQAYATLTLAPVVAFGAYIGASQATL
jgi:hypothetical protein